LVAVRAMAPVAGSPPKSALAMLATPWPMSSWFESCRSPIHAVGRRRRTKGTRWPRGARW
jgi:hypothetical protein